ncbi:hypothetical protein HWV00_17540 [Moritella sp. 24]|uniref:O-antigen ligase family protein n=1 Tax=Moritella sp. 24 TaxID=2746230 RepID=UPI001BA6898C|nr:O-antigen ligase family protein [Moritella sp. 24]QUM77883.1 hypothetical protein HWV00_17540 [Moritella sp. 24]
MLKNIVTFFDVVIFLALTFVGDYNLTGVPAFYIVWFMMVLYRILTGLFFKSNELFFQSFLILLLAPVITFSIFKPEYYTNFLFFIILYFNAFPILERIISKSGYNWAWILIILFSPIATLSIFNGDGRLIFIFGPNILYRIFGVMFLLGLILFLSKLAEDRSVLLLVISYFSYVISMLSTGSRGGMLVLIVTTLFMVVSLRHNKLIINSVRFMFLSIFIFCFYYWDDIAELFWRLVYFDQSNNSEAGRIMFYNNALKFFDDNNPMNILFGLGDNNHVFSFYPHNIILETMVNSGVYLLCLLVFSLFIFIVFMNNSGRYKHTIVVIPILMGSMLSGGALDNYVVFTFLFYNVYILLKNNERTKNKEQRIKNK